MGYDREFTFTHRAELIDYYVDEMYNALHAIVDGKKKGLEDFAQNEINEYWMYIMKLCTMYRDTTISKWLKIKRGNDKVYTIKKKMVRELDAHHMDVEHLVDIMFGEGTFKKYYDYCARYRKADDNKNKIITLCQRLGIKNPYSSEWGNSWKASFSADEIRNLTAAERNAVHFATIMQKEYYDNEEARREKYEKNFRNAYKWIVGFEPKKKSWGGVYYDDVHNNCVNKDNGVVYECSGEHIYGFYWCNTEVSFDYDSFSKSENKEQWIAGFYAECKEVADNRKAIEILKRIKAHYEGVGYSEKRFVADDYLRENTTEAEYIICSEFIRKQDKHYADEEARRRAAELARKQKEEEERKEKELQAKLRQEQIDACIERGADGFRDLWRLHYTNIYDAEREAASTKGFYQGGNVLLRFSMNKDKIESSKHIRFTIQTAKAVWKMVSRWHEHPETFKKMTIKTLDGTYTVSSYNDDILTAGCHDIAYAEMEHMWNEIVKLESNAA